MAEIKMLSAQLGASLKPAAAEYKAIGTPIAADVAKLTASSAELQTHNTAFIVQAREHSWLLTIALGVILFVIGTLCGVYRKGPNGGRSEQYGVANRAHSATFDSHAGEADHSGAQRRAEELRTEKRLGRMALARKAD